MTVWKEDCQIIPRYVGDVFVTFNDVIRIQGNKTVS